MNRTLLVAAIVLLAACDRGAQTGQDAAADSGAALDTAAAPAATSSDSAMTPGVQLDTGALKPGSRAGGLEVVSNTLAPAPQSLVGVKGSVAFKGQVQLAGSYRRHFDYPDVKLPCFWVDAPDWNKLPRVKGDSRVIWFCFSNTAEAIRELGALGTETRATIVIDDYTTNVEASDVWDTARLVRVVSKEVL